MGMKAAIGVDAAGGFFVVEVVEAFGYKAR